MPHVYANVPGFLHPVTGSSLSFAVIVAAVLNQLLAIGVPTAKQR